MPGDDWSVIVSIANSAANPLADQHGTANNLTPVHGVQNIKVDASKGDVTSWIGSRVQANPSSETHSPTGCRAALSEFPNSCLQLVLRLVHAEARRRGEKRCAFFEPPRLRVKPLAPSIRTVK